MHQRHYQQVLIDCQVGLTVNGRQLKLVGRHFVVAGFQRNAVFVSFVFHFAHKGYHAWRNRTEVMVLQLLVFSTFVPHQRPFGQVQVGAGNIQRLIHQKIFLFPTQVRIYFFHVRIKEFANFHSCFVYSRERFQQRGFIIERFARV